MRRITVTTLLCAAFAFPAAAAAQEKATRSVDDYLCAFAGKCGEDAQDDAQEVTKDAPETKGFSLARPNAAKPARTAPATRGFSLARPGAATKAAPSAAPTRQVASAPRPASKQKLAKASTKPSKATAVAGKRADLRLSFELGSATLTSQAREEAKVFADFLKRPELANAKFVIEGHTDSQGDRQANIALSQRRAQAVADFLASEGVSSDRLVVKGYGPDRPLEGRSAASRENRRVEAVLTS